MRQRVLPLFLPLGGDDDTLSTCPLRQGRVGAWSSESVVKNWHTLVLNTLQSEELKFSYFANQK
jgi:hypothetical protein